MSRETKSVYSLIVLRKAVSEVVIAPWRDSGDVDRFFSNSVKSRLIVCVCFRPWLYNEFIVCRYT